MTNIARGELPANSRAHAGTASHVPRDVADLVRRCSGLSGRQGYRVLARGLSGHIFFDSGRVIHAEFGEDCGLRAVVEMLRVGPVRLEAAVSAWPSQPSLHLGPELLLSMTERDTSRVMRKVDLPAEPPPLPQPGESVGAGLVSPVHPDAARGTGTRRAISAVMARVDAPPPPAALPSRRPSPWPASVPMSSITMRAVEDTAESRPRAQRAVSAPTVRTQKPRSRSVVVPRAAQRPAPASEPPASRAAPASESPQLRAARLPSLPADESLVTTMVRIASRGDLLAARGRNAEQLAEAAAFIHGLANLIAADFGRQGRANVHLSGQGMSLLVARSEVNDIAAALGPSERLTSLLGKVGLK
jgi:hypothetical protein